METTVSSAGAALFAATAGTSVSFVGAADAQAESNTPATTKIDRVSERFFFIFFSLFSLFATGFIQQPAA
jgi:hypothetical protein